jgi:hypothetical protein
MHEIQGLAIVMLSKKGMEATMTRPFILGIHIASIFIGGC